MVFLSSLDFSFSRSFFFLTYWRYLLHLSLLRTRFMWVRRKVFLRVVSFRCELTCARNNRLELTKSWFRIHGKHEDSFNLDVGYGFGVTLAGRPRGAYSNRRGATNRIQKIQCLGYCDAIGIVSRMFKPYYSNMILEISRGNQGERYREEGGGAGVEYRYKASYNYKGLKTKEYAISFEKWYCQCSIEHSTSKRIAVVWSLFVI